MVYITHYAIAPTQQTDNVTVEYSYTVPDVIKNEDIIRGGSLRLTDGTGALSSPNWGNGDLALAVATMLGVPATDVSVAGG